jgi:hypothetical protein
VTLAEWVALHGTAIRAVAGLLTLTLSWWYLDYRQKNRHR